MKMVAASSSSGPGLVIALISPARIWGPNEDAESVAINWRVKVMLSLQSWSSLL